jgi:hypothetical protein
MRLVPVALFAVLLLIVVEKVSAPLGNADTWFHLRFGAEFWGHWSLTDPGSVSTFGTRHWVPTQWLGEMVMYSFDRAFGLPGVAWLAGALVLAYATAIYLVSRRRAEPVCALLVTAVAMAASADGLSARPQVWSYLLVVVTTGAWLRTREDRRPRWWLIPLTWIWAMLHGMWILGPVVGLVSVAGIWLDAGLSIRRASRLVAIPIVSLIAAGLTPVGPSLYGAVVSVGSRAWYFTEWQPTSFRTGSALLGAGLVAVAVVALARAGGASWLDLGLLLLASGWLAYAVRTVPAGAAIAAPVAAGSLQTVLRRQVPLRSRERRAVFAACVISLGVLAALVPFTARHPADFRPRLDAALDALPARSTILNDDTQGGWLMWRHPDLNIVIDGYVDQYPTDWMRSYRSARALQPGWQHFVERTHADYEFFRRSDPITRSLRSWGWKRVSEQSGYELMQRSPSTVATGSGGPAAGR